MIFSATLTMNWELLRQDAELAPHSDAASQDALYSSPVEDAHDGAGVYGESRDADVLF